MKSDTIPSFWEQHYNLDNEIRKRAIKSFKLWLKHPFHPSLRFKCINRDENIWSARVTLGYRALGVMDDNVVTWFWIGSHDEYERYFG